MPPTNNLVLGIVIDSNEAQKNIKATDSALQNVGKTGSTVGQQLASGWSQMAISMAKGVVAGQLISEQMKRLIDLMKSYTVGAAEVAARNETLAVVNQQLARVNGYSGDFITRQTTAMKQLGITTTVSQEAIARMIFANLDLAKSSQLARLAQDAARIAGLNSSQTLEGIVHGLATANVRVLRTYGLLVNFQEAYGDASRKLGRALSDEEKSEVRLQTVLAKAPMIAGAYEAGFKTVGGQLMSLARYTEEAKNAIGQHLLPEMRAVIGFMAESAHFVQEHAAAFALLAKEIMVAVGALAAWKVGSVAIGALSAAGRAGMVGKGALLASGAGEYALGFGQATGAAGVASGLAARAGAFAGSTLGMITIAAATIIAGSVVVKETSAADAKERAELLRTAEAMRILGFGDVRSATGVTPRNIRELRANLAPGAQFPGEFAKPSEVFGQLRNRGANAPETLPPLWTLFESTETAKTPLGAARPSRLQRDLASMVQDSLDRLKFQGGRYSQEVIQKTGEGLAAEGIRALDVIKGGEKLAKKNEWEKIVSEYRQNPDMANRPAAENAERQLAKLAAAEKATQKYEQAIRGLNSAVESSVQFALGAIRTSTEGPAKYILGAEREYQKLAAGLDVEALGGVMEATKQLAIVRENLAKGYHEQVTGYLEDEMTKALQNAKEEADQKISFATEVYQKRIAFETEHASRVRDLTQQVYQFEEERAGMARDAALRQLEAQDARTLPEKLAMEQKRAEIEVAYLKSVHEVKMTLYGLETDALIAQSTIQMKAAKMSPEEIDARVKELRDLREQIAATMGESNKGAVEAAKENAQVRQIQLVRDQMKQTFDTLKSSANNLIDSLETGSKNWLQSLGAMLRAAVLTPLKEIASTMIASGLMRLFYGANYQGATRGVGGMSGATGGWATLLAAGGPGGVGFGINNTGWGIPIPGVTTGATGAATGLGGGTMMGVPGIWGQSAGGSPTLATAGSVGMFGGFKQSLTNMGNFASKFSTAHGGVNGAAGGALMLGGAMALMDGIQRKGLAGQIETGLGAGAIGWKLGGPVAGIGAGLLGAGIKRGGLSGLGMDVAGGAMLGFQFGGPIGAAIGAGIGAAIGIVRLFIKGAIQKCKEKVRAAYGIRIDDKMAQQIIDIAKQRYGGNVDMAIRAKDVYELITLYAQTTGQNTDKLPKQMAPYSFSMQNGQMTQLPTYINGTPSLGSATTSGSFSRGSSPATAAPGPTYLQLDGPATERVLSGQAGKVIDSQPRRVAAATARASRGNFDRNAGRARMLAPNLVIA